MEDAIKGTWAEKKMSKIQAMSYEDLQNEINDNLAKLSIPDRSAFVLVLNKGWESIVNTYASLRKRRL